MTSTLITRRVLGTVAFCQKDWIVTPRQSATCARELQAWTVATTPPGRVVRFLEVAGTDHAVVRNQIAEQFAGDWVLQLDCDHTYDPDILQRMLRVFEDRERGIDVLSGIYYQKKPPYMPVLFALNEQAELFQHLSDWPNRPFTTTGIGVGGGCLLVRRSVFERLAEEFPGEAPFDRIPALDMSEDLSFCHRCHRAGIPVWVHPGIEPGHLHTREVGAADFAPAKASLPQQRISMEAL